MAGAGVAEMAGELCRGASAGLAPAVAVATGMSAEESAGDERGESSRRAVDEDARSEVSPSKRRKEFRCGRIL